MLDLLQKGGPIMWLIVVCSVVALGVFLERLLYLHRASIAVGDLLRGLANILRKGDYAEALQECATTPGPALHFCVPSLSGSLAVGICRTGPTPQISPLPELGER